MNAKELNCFIAATMGLIYADPKLREVMEVMEKAFDDKPFISDPFGDDPFGEVFVNKE